METDAFDLVSGTADNGVWRTKKPLDLAEPGSYTVRIEAADADGDRDVDNSAGTLANYVAAVFEDVRLDRTEIDTDHRQVHRRHPQGTLAGDARAEAPGGPPGGPRRRQLDGEHHPYRRAGPLLRHGHRE